MRNIKFYRTVGLLCLMAAAFACLDGCVVAGVIADKLSPEPAAPAAYVPPKDNMLVIVENFQNPASVALVSERLDRQVTDELVRHRVAPIVNPDRLVELRLEKSKIYDKMQIADIGRAVGARQILYADLVDFAVEPALNAPMARGHAEARVRVIDAATGQTLWPPDSSAGFPVKAQTPFVTLKEGVTEQTLQQQVALQLSDGIARLFYKSSSGYSDSTDQFTTPLSGE
jgi:hypothetical protein